jgi:hypothetical protein
MNIETSTASVSKLVDTLTSMNHKLLKTKESAQRITEISNKKKPVALKIQTLSGFANPLNPGLSKIEQNSFENKSDHNGLPNKINKAKSLYNMPIGKKPLSN